MEYIFYLVSKQITTKCFELDVENGIMDRDEEQISGDFLIEEGQGLHSSDKLTCDMRSLEVIYSF